MRVLIYSNGSKVNFKKTIDFLEKDRLIIVDFFNDIEEAEYCTEIRKYDLFIIESENNMRKFVNFLKEVKVCNSESKVIFYGEGKDSKIMNYYIKDFLFFDKFDEIDNHLENELKEEIHYKNIIINMNNSKTFWILEDGKRREVHINTKVDFFLLTYFLRHYNEKINIGRLIDAISKEPELTKSSIAETSISSIRKLFKKELDINPIKAFKKIGYRFSY